MLGGRDDPLEREADRVADWVSGMSGTRPALSASALAAPCDRRACGTQERALDNVGAALAGPGQRLDPATRGDFETRLGHDFSQVRVHADAPADASARRLGARAYTVGTRIAFAAGAYAPDSHEGRHLLAHELAHVVQQADGAAPQVVRRQSHPGSRAPPASGGVAASAGVPYEKWSPRIEENYRRRGDTPRADAVRDCREWGGGFCSRLLTATEVYAKYMADEGARTEPGATAREPRPPSPVAGFVSAGAAAESAVAAATRTGAAAATAETAAVATAETAAVATATEAAPAAGAGALAGPGFIFAIGALSAYQLRKLGHFQEVLLAQGFVILDDALGQCIGQCHAPGPPRQAPRDFPPAPLPFVPPRGPRPLTPVGPAPFTPWRPVPDGDTELMKEWLKPTAPVSQLPTPTSEPAPKPLPGPGQSADEQPRRRECKELYDSYKYKLDGPDPLKDQMEAVRRAIEQKRPVTPEQRAEYCRWLEQRLSVTLKIFQTRDAYIWLRCDQFDWNNRGTTEDERREPHRKHLEQGPGRLNNLRERLQRHCRGPSASPGGPARR